MSSANKSERSTSENQEPDEEQPQPPDDSRPQEDTSSPPTAIGILDSIIGSSVNPHTRAGDILLGIAAAAGVEYVNVPRPSGTAKGSTEFYEMCTEVLGFESMSEKMDLSKVIEEHSSRLITSSGRKTKMRRVRVLPPFLSTLFCSGRPRFSLEKVTGSDGRLNIVMVDYMADLVGGGDEVAMARDDQEVDGGIGELKNDDHEMNIGDREQKEDMAADDRIEEMIGDNLVDQEVDDGNGEMSIGDRLGDDARDENREVEVTGDDRHEGDYR